MKIHNIEKEIEAYIIKNDNFSYDILLGLDVIKKFHLIQDDQLKILQKMNDGTIEIIRNKTKIIDNCRIENIKMTEIQEKLNHLDKQKSRRLNKLIEENSKGFAKNKFDVGKVNNHETHIKLLENKYISKKPYRCSIPD